MNSLSIYLEKTRGANQAEIIQALNSLQEHGIISDLCVTSEDVAWRDCERAIAFLKSQIDPLQMDLL